MHRIVHLASKTGIALLALGVLLSSAAKAEAGDEDANPPPPATTVTAATTIPDALKGAVSSIEDELVAKYGEAQRARIQRGAEQVAALWRPDDGDPDTFKDFVRSNFVADPETLDALFNRFEFTLEQLSGHMHEISRAFRRQVDLDLGPILPLDETLAAYDPSAHIQDDFFENKLAFVALLNFPLTRLEDRLRDGPSWSRRQWAEARLALQFSSRVPADVYLRIGAAQAETGQYIAEYNIWMHHLLDNQGNRLFPPGLRLISHWNLRDELKAAYSEKDGLPKQKMIQKVMERIIDQTIPEVVIDNPLVDWNPYTDEVQASTVTDSDRAIPEDLEVSNAAEPDTRYEMILKSCHAARLADPYNPLDPTLIDRRFNEQREIPEARVKALFESLLTAPEAKQVAKLIQKRLGRKLEPFDIWYNGFRARGAYTEAQLDEIVRKRYPTVESFDKDLPNILVAIGFEKDKADYLADNIVVDPSRGAGHAMGIGRREDLAHLRTRVGKDGMDYKGFNVAIHELGHNVEQVFSMKNIDYTLLSGVPNTAFTEAIAFVFQARDLELLGLAHPDAQADALRVLDDYWQAYEIAGVAMVDMAIWHWMYNHPDATAAQLKEATIGISKEVWNKYYAPVLGMKDVPLLSIYSHIVDAMLYTPDYPLGHLIAFQIYRQIQKVGNVGAEVERMARVGAVTPDIWMKEASGLPVSADPLLEATRGALKVVKK